MTNIIDTLDCIEGVQAGVVRYDENGHPVDTATAKTRAEDLFLVKLVLYLIKCGKKTILLGNG